MKSEERKVKSKAFATAMIKGLYNIIRKRSTAMGRGLLCAVCLMLHVSCCMLLTACADESIPPTAQAFIDKYFPHTNVVLTETDDEDDGIEYCVWLNDGTKIEFDAEGQWQRVSRKKSGVPATLIPQDIMQYVKSHYPEEVIFKLSKKHYGYKTELSNDIDLRFNDQGQFLEAVD